ncbi:hypothetical protein Tco_0267791 [Tanacetum coccineum]
MLNVSLLMFDVYARKYHGQDDLILQCALAQNPIAELILGQALLYDEDWFLDMPGDTRVIGDYISTSGILYSHKLARSFILYGSCEDIINMHYKLISYVVCYVGFDKDLPFGIVEAIDSMICLATSTNGARALVRISTTCKKLKEHAEQTSVLRVVSFQGLTDDYRKHLHPRDLIFQCARVGNQAAECILGKAFLSDSAFLHILSSNDQPTHDAYGSNVNGPIQHPRLVRSFIRLASSKDITTTIFTALNRYFLSLAGSEKYNAHGMYGAVRDMFSCDIKMFGDETECSESDLYESPNKFLAQVMQPHDVPHREEVIVIFDKIFPLTHV